MTARFHDCPRCQIPVELTDVPGWMRHATIPPEWRLIYAFLTPHSATYEPTRDEKIEACRWYAEVYGDRALVHAIQTARGCPRPHRAPPWDGLFDAIEDGLRKRGVTA